MYVYFIGGIEAGKYYAHLKITFVLPIIFDICFFFFSLYNCKIRMYYKTFTNIKIEYYYEMANKLYLLKVTGCQVSFKHLRSSTLILDVIGLSITV